MTKKKKTLERFEPYGEIPYVNSDALDVFIIEKFKLILGEFVYYSPKELWKGVGLQLVSNDGSNNMRNLGDPNGFCLAWTFWYLEMRFSNKHIDPRLLLSHCMGKIFGLDSNNNFSPKVIISYIRNYAHSLDMAKNKFMSEAGISNSDIYNLGQSTENRQKIVAKIETEFGSIIELWGLRV